MSDILEKVFTRQQANFLLGRVIDLVEYCPECNEPYQAKLELVDTNLDRYRYKVLPHSCVKALKARIDRLESKVDYLSSD